MEDELKKVSEALRAADFSRRAGLKERVWTRVLAPEPAPAFRPRFRWGFAASALALAALGLVLQPWFPVRRDGGPAESLRESKGAGPLLSPDWLSREALAAEAPAVRPTAQGEDLLDKIDRIERKTLDVDARYWAWRIAIYKDVTFDELEGYSHDWIMKEKMRVELFRKIKELIDSGKVRALTEEEDGRYEASVNQVREILGMGPRGTMPDRARLAAARKRLPPPSAAADDVYQGMLELDALHWAWRIASVRDITYDQLYGYSENWIIGGETRERLFARIRDILDSGRARELSFEEMERLDAGHKRVRELLRAELSDLAGGAKLSTVRQAE